MRVQFDHDGIKKSLISAIVMVGVLLFVETVSYSSRLMPVYIVIGGAVYIAMLRFLKAVDQRDIQLIRAYLGPRLAFASSLLSALLAPTEKQ